MPAIVVDDGGLARAVDVAGHEADALARDPAAAAGHDRREPPAVDDEAAPLVDHLDHVTFRRQAQVITVPTMDLARDVDTVGARRTGGAERKGEQHAGDNAVHRNSPYEQRADSGRMTLPEARAEITGQSPAPKHFCPSPRSYFMKGGGTALMPTGGGT